MYIGVSIPLVGEYAWYFVLVPPIDIAKKVLDYSFW